MTEPRGDLARNLFTVLFICGLAALSLWIVRPFLLAIVWATMIVIPTWSVMLWLEKRLGNKRGRAVAVMTLVLLGFVFVPFLAAIGLIADSAEQFPAKLAALKTEQVPPPPAWVANIPVVGAKAAAKWQSLAGDDLTELVVYITPYSDQILGWLKVHVGGIGSALILFLLTVIVAALLYSDGEAAADRIRLFARKLGGDQGEGAVILAGKAVKSVALGVVVTAVVQSIACGIGLAIAGVPFAGALTVLMLVCCIAQIGPMLVMIPAVIWTFGSGETGWGIFLLVWTLVFGLMDNVVRPMLIKRGVDLPMTLIFAGVIGGLLTLGVVGIFVGPVILAVAHTLLEAWIGVPADRDAPEPASD
ncbi:MAG: AI-2E family transporter YdiK [Thermoanaerobaculia bacterium]|jgi:predicted PurR-regulated permease PerM